MTARLDHALDTLAPYGPEFGSGLSNHGPMAAEALEALGLDEAIPRFVEHYRHRLEPAAEPQEPLFEADFAHNLGRIDRFTDFAAFFQDRLERMPWRKVVADYAPRLISGLAGGAGHGLIRTAHAARALDRARTPPRLDELARGLAYWAGAYLELPAADENVPSRDMGLSPEQALDRIPLLPEDQRGSGLIVDRLAPLSGFPPFRGVMELVDTHADPGAFLTGTVRGFAAAYLASARDEKAVVPMIHAVTAPQALRLLLPCLPPKEVPWALARVWQFCAALLCATGHHSPPAEPGSAPPDFGELARRAAKTLDPHAIKFTEALARQDRLHPDPVLPRAALDAVMRLGSQNENH